MLGGFVVFVCFLFGFCWTCDPCKVFSRLRKDSMSSRDVHGNVCMLLVTCVWPKRLTLKLKTFFLCLFVSSKPSHHATKISAPPRKPIYFSYAACGAVDDYSEGNVEACVNQEDSRRTALEIEGRFGVFLYVSKLLFFRGFGVFWCVFMCLVGFVSFFLPGGSLLVFSFCMSFHTLQGQGCPQQFCR